MNESPELHNGLRPEEREWGLYAKCLATWGTSGVLKEEGTARPAHSVNGGGVGGGGGSTGCRPLGGRL